MDIIKEGKFIDVNSAEFCKIKYLNYNLAYMALRRLATHHTRELCYDYTMNKSMTRGTVLAVALAMKEYFEEEFKDETRIGIVLPSGIPALLVNLALQMAGKSCVNLNFSLARKPATHCIEVAGIKSIISAHKLRGKLREKGVNFPWTDRFYDVEKIIKAIPKSRIIRNVLLVKLSPISFMQKFFRIRKRVKKDQEASIIFTSGSEGMPKAAVLTHKNIMANCFQMHFTGIFETNDERLHSNLPIFHSFGQTIQVWFSAIFGCRQTMVASPLEVKQNFEAMQKKKSTIIISTPTFLKSYYRKGNAEEGASLRTVIGGAEKTPRGFATQWQEKFPNSLYTEGYGLTEASPVVSVNLRESIKPNKYRPYPSKVKEGSIGPLFAGMQAGIMDIDTKEFLPIGSEGMLCLKGDNIFHSYLDLPEENEKKFHDGWLLTGDIACLDEEGFLYIKGRLSRFSKIGGEMVPHVTIEEAVTRLFGSPDDDELSFAVGACEDEAKGESIVLLSSKDVDMITLRKKLQLEGLPNLWIPKYIIKVDKIPVLPTGKMDLRFVQELCKSAKDKA